MAQIFDETSRTFDEYLLIPNLTTKNCMPANVDLSSSLDPLPVRQGWQRCGSTSPLSRRSCSPSPTTPWPSSWPAAAACPSSSASQSIAAEAEMVRKVKTYKAGFVTSDSNLKPDETLADLLKVKQRTGHSTMAVTANGEPDGKLLGIVTSKDYRVTRDELDKKVADFMTPSAGWCMARSASA